MKELENRMVLGDYYEDMENENKIFYKGKWITHDEYDDIILGAFFTKTVIKDTHSK